MKKIVWFRFDLRTDDNCAFLNACNDGDVLPIFIYDKGYWELPTSSSFHLQFTEDSLEELKKELKSNYQTDLNIFYGNTIEILKTITEKFNIQEIYSNKVYKNIYLLDVDTECKNLFKEKSITWKEFNQFGIQSERRKRHEWANQWNKFISIEPKKNNINCRFLNAQVDKKYVVKTNQISTNFIQRGGRLRALSLLESFLFQRSVNYQTEMSSPITGQTSCSRLSPHIANGTISLREINSYLKKTLKTNLSYEKRKSLNSFKSRLAWHCHFIQKLYDEPEIEFQNMNRAYDGLREDFNEKNLIAWKNGQTGFPFVDACMRYLKNRGWINFRMRAMLVSFASYQLWLDWRITSKHLAKLFTDYEPGIHYSQFQMQSGTTGINTIRIYNPIKQSFDQDPKGKFIKKWVPELRNLPTELVHEPWRITPIEKKGLCDLEFSNYPSPIIDNKEASKNARDRLWAIKKTEKAKELSKIVLSKHASMKARR